MRSCACDTASRPCVRTVLCSSAFLLVPSSPSTDSAADCSALFAGFAGTIDECDFFAPCIIGYGLRPSRCGPGHDYRGQDEDIPVPAQKMCVHAGGLMTTRTYALPYRRFVICDARLGADVVRYSFIVVDFHHLLLAGLTGALCLTPRSYPAPADLADGQPR